MKEPEPNLDFKEEIDSQIKAAMDEKSLLQQKLKQLDNEIISIKT